jgi:hypothetical protein
VAQTEEGLLELGLGELARVFDKASALMVPFVERMSPEHTPDRLLEKAGLAECGPEINSKAWDLRDPGTDKSAIYDAWVRYTRRHPEQLFGP